VKLIAIILLSLAALRVLYLMRHSVMDAIGFVILFPFTLADDIRRNGREVLKTIFGWSAAIGVLFLIITVFQISF
jgi:hypothetical protein